jgi:hypothetical protein
MATCGSSQQVTGNCSFLTASQARDLSMCPTTIWSEIHAIQDLILAAIDQCEMELIIADGTPITANNSITSVASN